MLKRIFWTRWQADFSGDGQLLTNQSYEDTIIAPNARNLYKGIPPFDFRVRYIHAALFASGFACEPQVSSFFNESMAINLRILR